MPDESPRIVDGDAMLLAGMRRHHQFDEGARTIPAQWQEFAQLMSRMGSKETVTYGVLCGADEQARTFEYMCAIQVPSFDGLPPDAGRMRIPAQRYAVFTHTGPVSAIPKAWEEDWAWVKASRYENAGGPEFERYDERWDVKANSGTVEIWVCVKPKA